MVYIENDGALFRGPARGVPEEVWSPSKRAFVPYKGAGKPRDVSWGSVISEAEARELMGADAPAAAPAPAKPAAAKVD